jgi:hypothetical protein
MTFSAVPVIRTPTATPEIVARPPLLFVIFAALLPQKSLSAHVTGYS